MLCFGRNKLGNFVKTLVHYWFFIWLLRPCNTSQTIFWRFTGMKQLLVTCVGDAAFNCSCARCASNWNTSHTCNVHTQACQHYHQTGHTSACHATFCSLAAMHWGHNQAPLLFLQYFWNTQTDANVKIGMHIHVFLLSRAHHDNIWCHSEVRSGHICIISHRH